MGDEYGCNDGAGVGELLGSRVDLVVWAILLMGAGGDHGVLFGLVSVIFRLDGEDTSIYRVEP